MISSLDAEVKKMQLQAVALREDLAKLPLVYLHDNHRTFDSMVWRLLQLCEQAHSIYKNGVYRQALESSRFKKLPWEKIGNLRHVLVYEPYLLTKEQIIGYLNRDVARLVETIDTGADFLMFELVPKATTPKDRVVKGQSQDSWKIFQKSVSRLEEYAAVIRENPQRYLQNGMLTAIARQLVIAASTAEVLKAHQLGRCKQFDFSKLTRVKDRLVHRWIEVDPQRLWNYVDSVFLPAAKELRTAMEQTNSRANSQRQR